MKVFTIGFTKKTAEQFFEILRKSGAKRVVDVRLNNLSQLAGFTKKDDLAYFLKMICDIDYVHIPLLAPTKELLNDYKKKRCDWKTYERHFLELMNQRQVVDKVSRHVINESCLLCSEEKPDRCHRRVVAEFLKEHWGDLQIKHLGKESA